MPAIHYWHCLAGIIRREMLRYLHQRERLVAALVRPLVWLLIFGAGLRGVMAIGAAPPYTGDVAYEVYVVPGLLGMILLFNGMQSSLSMVYDREMGSMKTLLVSPLPRWYLLACKLMAGVTVSILQAYTFLACCLLFGVEVPVTGLLRLFPFLVIAGLMLGSIGLLLSSWVRQLENFAGIMNFVIFPAFFLSSALYPLERFAESNRLLHYLAAANPFTHATEMLRFALHGQFAPGMTALTLASLLVFLAAAVRAYDPARGRLAGRAGN
jgi:ABC-2 type transport system permease protein